MALAKKATNAGVDNVYPRLWGAAVEFSASNVGKRIFVTSDPTAGLLEAPRELVL